MMNINLIKPVASKAEFLNFIRDWIDPQQEDIRKSLMSSFRTEDAAIKHILGSFLKSEFIRIQDQVVSTPEDERSSQTELISQCADLSEQLAYFRNSVPNDTFKYLMLTEVGLSTSELLSIEESLHDTNTLEKKLFGILESVKTADIHTAKKLLKSYRESPEAKKQLSSKDTKKLDGTFVQLIQFITTYSDAKVRAEMFAMVDLYLTSGWAVHDVLDKDISTLASEHPTALMVRALIDDIANNKIVDHARFRDALIQRFDTIRMVCEITYDDDDQKIAKLKGSVAEKKKAKTHTNREYDMAGRGEVDIFLPDCINPELAHVAMVSSDSYASVENGQFIYHPKGILNALNKNCLDRFKNVSISVHIPSVLYDAVPEDGKFVNNNFMRAINGTDSIHNKIINLIPFLSTIGKVPAESEAYVLIDVNLNLIGANSDHWAELMSNARNTVDADEKKSLFADAIGRIVSHSTLLLSNMDFSGIRGDDTGYNKWMAGYINVVSGFASICTNLNNPNLNKVAKTVSANLKPLIDKIKTVPRYTSNHHSRLTELANTLSTVKAKGNHKILKEVKLTNVERSSFGQTKFERLVEKLKKMKDENPELIGWNKPSGTGNPDIDKDLFELRRFISVTPKNGRNDKTYKEKVRALHSAGFLSPTLVTRYVNPSTMDDTPTF